LTRHAAGATQQGFKAEREAPVGRIYLLRHAKSSWGDPSQADVRRPLAPRGRKALKALARHMRAMDVAPDLVLCSPAVRAVQTWEGVASGLPPGTPVEFDEAVYHSGADDLLARLRRLPPEIDSVLVVGHNPALEDLALGLVAAGDPDLRTQLETKFPTGALASLELAATWHDLRWGTATLVAYVVPRDLA
jgi:phosphohistidine phosphatase